MAKTNAAYSVERELEGERESRRGKCGGSRDRHGPGNPAETRAGRHSACRCAESAFHHHHRIEVGQLRGCYDPDLHASPLAQVPPPREYATPPDWSQLAYHRYWMHNDAEHHALRIHRFKLIHWYNDDLKVEGARPGGKECRE
jgi:hypothetical protein